MQRQKKDITSYNTTFLITILAISTVIFFIGKSFGNIGTFIALFLIIILAGRQIGNRLSRKFLFSDTSTMMFAGLIWGGIIALLFRLIFLWTHPGIILTILGYGEGLYASVINYDVFMKDPKMSNLFPNRLDDKQDIMNFASIGIFIILSIIFYFLIK